LERKAYIFIVEGLKTSSSATQPEWDARKKTVGRDLKPRCQITITLLMDKEGGVRCWRRGPAGERRESRN